MAAAVIFDVVANLPSPTAFNNRFFFYATDTTTMYVSDGSTWQTVAVGTPGGGTLTSITSTDLSVTVTNPAGPIVDLAVANSPAIDGVTVTGTPTTGDVLTATSASTADWAPSGSSTPLTEIIYNMLAGGDWSAQTVDYYPAGASGTGADGYAGSMTSVPVLVGAAGTVAGVGTGFVKNIPVDADPYDVTIDLVVTNLTGTEVIIVEVDLTTTAGDTSATIDWTTATPSSVAGTDLTWDGTGAVTTTAGGVFVASLSAFANWD